MHVATSINGVLRAMRAVLAVTLTALPAVAFSAAPAAVFLLSLDGAVSPATADYAVRGIRKAADAGAGLVVLRMDTPGGLDTSMRQVIKEILAAPLPVAVFVGPSGARAASAGTYILYASHIAAMAPGLGPMNTIPAASNARGNASRSDRKP